MYQYKIIRKNECVQTTKRRPPITVQYVSTVQVHITVIVIVGHHFPKTLFIILYIMKLSVAVHHKWS